MLINAVIEGEVEAHIKREVKQAAKELLKAAKHPKLACLKSMPESSENWKFKTQRSGHKKPLNNFKSSLNHAT